MNIVIAAGGTGGHLYPAVALAKEFQQQDPKTVITFVGAGRHLEESILTHEGFTLAQLKVRGIVGRGGWGTLQALFLLPHAIWRALRLLKAKGTDLVVGTGGYFSPPVVLAAWLLGVYRVILEPNAMPGLANRVLGPLANRIFLAFEQAKTYFNPSKVRIVGTPLRKEFSSTDSFSPSGRLNNLLVFGGSQGARAINTAMGEALQHSRILRKDLHIIHQTGFADHARMRTLYEEAGVDAEVVPFLYDMPKVLRAGDLVIARSGAGTLAELAVCGKPAILIPYPHATHGHQEKNARAAEAEGAAVVIPQSELTGGRLAQEIEYFLNHPDRLKTMAERSFGRRITNATARMVEECKLLLANP
jgi:UDP-N-acetylglucosamine--N-acetylmuramyl-(pentapeptide) pyrophosphoryl-undecaprenol N-acetylglucosamine transferase